MCSAIFLHNLKENNSKFKKFKLAYLLKLSDELQDWERPNGDGKYNNYKDYNIDVDENKIKIIIKNKRLNKIKSSLRNLDDSLIFTSNN